jgi:putative AdoMet-dependent methyltransferase
MEKDLFNDWADNYNSTVVETDREGGFPFAGYENVIQFIYDKISPSKGTRVLDLGIGSGKLSHELFLAGCEITGVDFSEKMLDKARKLLPKATLILHDLSTGLPQLNGKFDAIISTYAMHHFDYSQQTELLSEMLSSLTPGGKIYIGDVVFNNRKELENCRMNHMKDWDESEFYISYMELFQSLTEKCRLAYYPISWCGGVIILENKDE